MKIKSWIGNEVEARVGMVCKLQTADIGEHDHAIVTITAATDHDIELDGNCWLNADSDGGGAELTMLHCPFQVWDWVHDWLVASQQYSRAPIKITKQEFADALNRGDIDAIHANRDLRDAPEYKP